MEYADEPVASRAGQAWRTWLMTGARREPIDRRRVRGAHLGIKRMLVEGMRIPGDQPYTWKEFSDAMVRHAVGDAMRMLGEADAELVKLAYFGGMSNREIARHVRMNETAVQRRLRAAIDAISRHVERGRRLGQRVIAAVAVWLTGRWAGDAVHGAIQGVAVATAAAVIATHPAALPGSFARPHPQPAAAPASPAPVDPMPSPNAVPVTVQVPSTSGASVAGTGTQLPAVSAPVTLPPAPSLPAAPSTSSVTQQVTTKVKQLL